MHSPRLPSALRGAAAAARGLRRSAPRAHACQGRRRRLPVHHRRRTATSASTATRSRFSRATASSCSTPTARRRPRRPSSPSIRTLTDQPVRYVVNSHWHWDHWYGTETYQRAFPDVRIVAHEKTRELMMGPALEFNRPGLETAAARLHPEPREESRAAEARPAAAESRGAEGTRSTRTASSSSRRRTSTTSSRTSRSRHRLAIELGERHIEVLNYGRAVTPGDTFVYLPKERSCCSAI